VWLNNWKNDRILSYKIRKVKVWVVRKSELHECFRRSLAIRITQVWLYFVLAYGWLRLASLRSLTVSLVTVPSVTLLVVLLPVLISLRYVNWLLANEFRGLSNNTTNEVRTGHDWQIYCTTKCFTHTVNALNQMKYVKSIDAALTRKYSLRDHNSSINYRCA